MLIPCKIHSSIIQLLLYIFYNIYLCNNVFMLIELLLASRWFNICCIAIAYDWFWSVCYFITLSVIVIQLLFIAANPSSLPTLVCLIHALKLSQNYHNICYRKTFADKHGKLSKVNGLACSVVVACDHSHYQIKHLNTLNLIYELVCFRHRFLR